MLSVLVGVNRGLNIKTTLGEILKVDLPDNRVFGLDLLRAAAILFVVYGHGAFTLAALLPKTLVQLPLMDGVSIFFVLSGYLIGGIILKIYERFPADAGLVWRFWLRRWFRTLPNYFLILVVLVVYHVAFEDLSFAAVWRYFFFLQNFASNHPAFFPEAWSLSIEEWFYIFLPVSLLILVRAGLRVPTALLSLIAITIIASLAFRYGRLLELEANDHPLGKLRVWDGIFRKQVVMRLDSLMYGVFGAYLHYYHGGGVGEVQKSVSARWSGTAAAAQGHELLHNRWPAQSQFVLQCILIRGDFPGDSDAASLAQPTALQGWVLLPNNYHHKPDFLFNVSCSL